MKKLLSIIIAVMLLVMMFTACGDGKSGEPTGTLPEVNENVNSETDGTTSDNNSNTVDTDKQNSIVDNAIVEGVPYGTYTSQVGGYMLEFSDYDPDRIYGNTVALTYPSGETGELMFAIFETGQEDSIFKYVDIGTSYARNGSFDSAIRFLYYPEQNVLQASDNGFYNLRYFAEIDCPSISGYFSDDNGAFLCFCNALSANAQNSLLVPDLNRKLFYICTKEVPELRMELPTKYIYEDELELVETFEESNTKKTYTYRYNSGNYFTDDFVLEYKAVDYENMTGLNTIWTFPVMPFEEYEEKNNEIYDQLYLLDQEFRTYLAPTVQYSPYLYRIRIDTQKVDESSGEGFYFNGVPITDESTLLNIFGEYTYASFAVTETISYVNGEYVSSFSAPTMNYCRWVCDDFEFDINDYYIYIFAHSDI